MHAEWRLRYSRREDACSTRTEAGRWPCSVAGPDRSPGRPRRQRGRRNRRVGQHGRRAAETIKVGLITKDVTNPFFVKMKQGATAQAKKLGAELLYAAGKQLGQRGSDRRDREPGDRRRQGDPDHRGRRKAENPAILKARKAGVMVIALDTRRSRRATDALFATNNLNAGVLIGKYARAATKGKTVTIAMLDEHAGSSVGALRHNGIPQGLRDQGQQQADRLRGQRPGRWPRPQTAMENCLQKNPDIDVVYTINEPSAAGAWTALKNAGKTQSGVTIVSVDGGCAGVRNVRAGVIDATSQQYPLRMARSASQQS